jgi:hypothetical protein
VHTCTERKIPVKVASLNKCPACCKKNVCIFIAVIPELHGKVLVSAQRCNVDYLGTWKLARAKSNSRRKRATFLPISFLTSRIFMRSRSEVVRIRNQIVISPPPGPHESQSANEKSITRIIAAGERGRRNDRSRFFASPERIIRSCKDRKPDCIAAVR